MKLFTNLKSVRVAVLAVSLFAAVCVPLSAQATASAYSAPKNVVVQINYGQCTMWFQHGEALGAAYSKFKGVAGHCDPGTKIQVVANTGSGPECGLWTVPWGSGCSVTSEGSTQSMKSAFSSLSLSRVTLCSNGSPLYCTTRNYTIAN